MRPRGGNGNAVQALLDFSDVRLSPSEWEATLARLTAGDGIAGLVSRATCILPDEAPGESVRTHRWRIARVPGIQAAGDALAAAGRTNEHLLVLRVPVAAAESAAALEDAFERDPMFGSAHPRYSVHAGGRVLPLVGANGTRPSIERGALLDIPDHYLAAEYVSPCFLVRREVLANIEPPLSSELSTVRELLFEYLRRVRRTGYRSVILNGIVVALGSYADGSHRLDCPPVPRRHPDTELAQRLFTRHADIGRERRLSALCERPLPVLLDARNLGPTVNGTTKVVLGLADALYRARTDWAVTLVASGDATISHALPSRYPNWTICDRMPQRAFATAFRPTQPWDLSELRDLHDAAAVNIYLMLDTIAWDVVYMAPARLDATWTHAARYADALLFISDFSRQRFAARFPVHPDVHTDVCHLSLDPADYISSDIENRWEAPFWFVVGNHYDHKHVRSTLALLARAFPTTKLAVLGAQAGGNCLVALPSGKTDEGTVQSLYASADIVIFPSLYEGFGLPVVNALAYGKTVVARESALLREIAAAYKGPGRLISYSTPDELVQHLSCLRHGRQVPELPLGLGRSEPAGWSHAAARIVESVERLVRPDRRRREPERHAAMTLVDAWTTAGASG